MNTEGSQITVLDRLQKDVVPGLNLFETILFSITTVIGIILFFLALFPIGDTSSNIIASSTLTLIDIPLGVLAATFLSKKSKYGYLLLTIDALFYGTANLLNGQYALGVVNDIIIPITFIIGFILNIRRDGKEIETKQLTILTGTGVVVGIILISITLGFLLPMILNVKSFSNKDWLNSYNTWFDAFAASLMIFATIGAVLGFRETWILYMTSNIMKIMLFLVLVIWRPEDASGMLLLLAISYLINTIFGLIVWSKRNQN